jgi:hypothetical protein
MTDTENGLTETEGIRRVDIASDHVVVHQPVDDACVRLTRWLYGLCWDRNRAAKQLISEQDSALCGTG